MFFMRIGYFLLILAFIWAIWRFVIKPILESKGVEVDEVDPIETDHTKRLDKAKEKFGETEASATAVKEELEIAKKAKKYKKQIDAADEKLK